MRPSPTRPPARLARLLLSVVLLAASPGWWASGGALQAQATGSVRGSIVSVDDGSPVAHAVIDVEDTSRRTLSADDGTFELTGIPAGERVLIVSALFNGGQRVAVSVPADGEVDVTVEFRPVPFALDGIRVTSASRIPQRVVESPVAIDVADKVDQRNYSSTGQHVQVIKGLTGMDVAANGIHDHNVNTRGFNADLTQRLLVLMDGRDLAVPFLGTQEWSALSVPLDDIDRIEVVRGPGSALYGANAYNGVINLVTPAPRAIVGNKLSVAGGELGTVRGDARVARVFGPGERFGIRANAGYYRSEDWHRSRTNLGDLEREYEDAIDPSEFPVQTPAPGFEVIPLNGQTVASVPAVATGEPDPVQNIYGTARLDYYADQGAVGTLEGGVAHVENQVVLTNGGRFQVDHAWRPWARAAWAHDRYYGMVWYSGRSSRQRSLASGAPINERSSFLHAEAQWNATGLDDAGRLVVGGSYRQSLIDSRGTLVAPVDDDRSDWAAAVFGQGELEVAPGLRLVAAGRYDGSNLYDSQFSPKGAVVFEPAPGHSLRTSVGRAFQTPRMTNFFVRVPLGVPSDLSALEAALRAQFGAALDGVPQGELFTNSSSVPALALGNRDLGVERVVSWEAGYRVELRERVQLTVDGYYSVIENFVSALLPNANPTYGPWTAPASVDPSIRADLEAAVLTVLGPGAGLTRLHDEQRTTATVFSYGNAGRATDWGVEVGLGIELTPRVHLDGSYTWFDYRVDEGVPLVPGDLIVPNTPEHKGAFQARYTSLGLDAWARLTVKSAFDWSSGIFRGWIPASERVDAGVGYVIRERLRIHAAATNLLDEATYHIYGGSIDRRRVLLGLTAYW